MVYEKNTKVNRLIGPEILDHVYFIHTENLGWSRNSGPRVFHSYRKIWAGPDILDQLYFIHTENLDWSRNSGQLLVFHYQ